MTTGIISGTGFLNHQTGRHPENGQRQLVLNELAQSLLNAENSPFVEIEPQAVDIDLLEKTHQADYVQELAAFCNRGGGLLEINTKVSTGSYEAALLATGGLVEGVKAVVERKVQNSFALVRPPGHHALPDEAFGFCLFNNVAVAARYLLEEAGLQRVMIVDWDVHHGNGTQAMFYDDPRVLFFSSHQFPLFPGSGHFDEYGVGAGEGFNANMPLPAGSGDEIITRVWDELVEPLADRFRPEFILVSAGFDGHWRDPLGGLQLSTDIYADLTRRVMRLADRHADGKLALTLEGGYDLTGLQDSAQAVLQTLAGQTYQPKHDSPGGLPANHPTIKTLIKELQAIHGI